MTLIRKHDIVKSVLLSILTLGIFGWIWQYRLIRNTQALKTEQTGSAGELLCCIFLPFYPVFWWSTRAQALKKVYRSNGLSPTGRIWVYVLLSLLFPVLFPNLMNAGMMQSSFNKAPDAPLRSLIKTNARKNDLKRMIVSCALFFPGIPLIWLFPGMLLLYAGGRDHDVTTGNWPVTATTFLEVVVGLTAFGIVMIAATFILHIIDKKGKKPSGKEASENHE